MDFSLWLARTPPADLPHDRAAFLWWTGVDYRFRRRGRRALGIKSGSANPYRHACVAAGPRAAALVLTRARPAAGLPHVLRAPPAAHRGRRGGRAAGRGAQARRGAGAGRGERGGRARGRDAGPVHPGRDDRARPRLAARRLAQPGARRVAHQDPCDAHRGQPPASLRIPLVTQMQPGFEVASASLSVSKPGGRLSLIRARSAFLSSLVMGVVAAHASLQTRRANSVHAAPRRTRLPRRRTSGRATRSGRRRRRTCCTGTRWTGARC